MKARLAFARYRLVRRVQPEWLDALAAADPRAIHSRRDLRLVNRLMGHARAIRHVLQEHLASYEPRIAELGAGDGTLLLRVLDRAQRGEVVLVDREPAVTPATAAGFEARGLRLSVNDADVLEWLAQERTRYDAIVSNLFLHHFDDAQLAKLLELVRSRAKLFVACEPRRARLPLAASRMLRFLGCNDVTRHDAAVSVLAGFQGTELSKLWPSDGRWSLRETRAGLFSHRFVARLATGHSRAR